AISSDECFDFDGCTDHCKRASHGTAIRWSCHAWRSLPARPGVRRPYPLPGLRKQRGALSPRGSALVPIGRGVVGERRSDEWTDTGPIGRVSRRERNLLSIGGSILKEPAR